MSNDLRNLRSSLLDDLEAEQAVERYEKYAVGRAAPQKIFGMTAVERMFMSVGCFILTSLGGFLLLLVLDKIAL